jgi:hypothetical protein
MSLVLGSEVALQSWLSIARTISKFLHKVFDHEVAGIRPFWGRPAMD